jgi:hypothetical protein
VYRYDATLPSFLSYELGPVFLFLGDGDPRPFSTSMFRLDSFRFLFFGVTGTKSGSTLVNLLPVECGGTSRVEALLTDLVRGLGVSSHSVVGGVPGLVSANISWLSILPLA